MLGKERGNVNGPNPASWGELPQRMNAEILSSGILIGYLQDELA
jgi:hypothetical protein